jgi:hypothetical protein
MKTGSAKLLPRSASIRQKLQHLRGHRLGVRAARFKQSLAAADGQAHSLLDFDTVAALPDWALFDDTRQIMVGLGAAILDERGAIDRELSGDRLAAIAALVGADIFERLCDLPLPNSISVNPKGHLPRPEDFATIGANLRRWAMPAALREKGISNADADRARLLCLLSASLIETGNSAA